MWSLQGPSVHPQHSYCITQFLKNPSKGFLPTCVYWLVVEFKRGCLCDVGDHGHELHWRCTPLLDKAYWAYGRNLYAEHVVEKYRAHSRIVRPS